MRDLFKPWHDHLAVIRRGINSGKIKISKELTDKDIAINYVIGIALQVGYEYITAEMVCYLLKALTDVDFEKSGGDNGIL